MLDAVLGMTTEVVESQAVLRRIDKIAEFVLEGGPLIGCDEALEDGVLNALAVIQALFGHSGESSLAGLVFCGDIVGNEYKHGEDSDLFRNKWEIGEDFAAQEAGEKSGLDMGDQAERHFFIEHGVGDEFLLFFLISLEEGASGVIGEEDGTRGLGAEIGFFELLAVDEVESDTVGDEGAEFFHEVEGESGTAGAVAMEEADGGVESSGFAGPADVGQEK